MNIESADARSSNSTSGYMNDAAGKKKKEDDIKNESNAMNDKIEKEEVITDKIDDKEDKTKKVDDKKLKSNVKVNKMTSKINKMKNETPRSRLKSKDKSDKKQAKQLGVNVRKISEFLLLNKGREDFVKHDKPAIKPAKQENKEKIETLSDIRMGGGGGRKLLVEKTFTDDGNQRSADQVGNKADYYWPDVDKSRRLSQ